jgi:hypothetical protein
MQLRARSRGIRPRLRTRLSARRAAAGISLALLWAALPAAPASSVTDVGRATCLDPARTLVTTPSGTITTKYSPPVAPETTYIAKATTWRPDLKVYPIGIESGAIPRVCWLDGAVFGSIPSAMTWETAHSYNQPCVRIVATEWMYLDGVRCDNTDDGFRPRETSTGAQNVTMTVRNTYFTHIHDDCIENDGVIGGLLQDNLWNGCNMGISEKPTSGSFTQPAGETLTLDHMLMGLWVTPHDSGPGEGSLFKWSSSANQLVIKCSVFKVDQKSLNGAQSMEVPATIDDSACPTHPTTIVWLGGGPYPGTLPSGVKVSTNIGVWKTAVTAWKCTHGYQVTGC